MSTYDPAEDLLSDDAVDEFMTEAFQTEDVAYVAHALGVVARARGLAQVADKTGLSSKQIHQFFSASGDPTLKTTLAVMKSLGIMLTAKTAL